mgnify:CR=1 FL=1
MPEHWQTVKQKMESSKNIKDMKDGYWCVFCNSDLPQRGAVCRHRKCASFGYLHVGLCEKSDCQERYHADPYRAFEIEAPFGRIKDFYYRDTGKL